MTMNSVRFGSDIEWFLQDTISNEIISAEGLVKGTKEKPFDLGVPGFKSSLDNVLAEGNIPPVSTREEWVAAIQRLEQFLTEMVPAQMRLTAMADYRLDPRFLETENAQTFGCNPSFLAWTGDLKDNPPMETVGNLRSAGFHVHCSWATGQDYNEQVTFIKAMDYYLGLPAVLQEPANERRKLYGRAGEFRSGNGYDGCEYRVLSSYWAANSTRQGWVFDRTQMAIQAINENRLGFLDQGDAIQEAINQGDRGIASALLMANL